MPVTYPTAPTAVSISVAPVALRTVNCATALAFTTALADAQYGDEIVLTAGNTFTGTFTPKIPTGTRVGTGGDNYVTIRSSLSANLSYGTRVSNVTTNMAKIIGATGAATNAAIDFVYGAQYYRFIGIELAGPTEYAYQRIVNSVPAFSTSVLPGYQDQAVSANYVNHISFERCYIHADYDYGVQFGLALCGSHIRVKDCYFDEMKQNRNSEAKAIWLAYGAGPYLIENCYVAGHGINFFVQGSAQSGEAVIPGYEFVVPSDITVRKSIFTRKLMWRRDDATYQAACDETGAGTISSQVGSDIIFSTAHGLTLGTYGPFVKDVTLGQYRKVTAIVSTTRVTLASAFGSSPAGHSWRYNAVDTSTKNLFEFKAAKRIKVDSCLFQHGWSDGQAQAFVLRPKEYGHIFDFEMVNCEWDDCSAWDIAGADWQQGPGFGSSPYPMNRIWIHNNLLKNMGSADSVALAANSTGISLSTGQLRYGVPISSGTIKVNNVATGAGRTFTASDADVFEDFYATAGLEIRYGVGRATITGYTSAAVVTATITVAFPAAAAVGAGTSARLWNVGYAAANDTDLIPDSWIFEHNTVAGASINYTNAFLFQSDLNGPTKMTNFVMTKNLFHSGADGNNGGGIKGEGHSWGDTALSAYCTAQSITKNVFFGSQMCTGNNFASGYATGGAGSTHDPACHDPDQTGSTAGGSVGFTDYAGGDYSLNGSSPYRAAVNWTGDNTVTGCDITTLNAALVTTISGAAESSGTFTYLPIRWP